MTKETHKPVFAGVDVGSLTTKSVIVSNGTILGYGLIPTGINTEENGLKALQKALDTAKLT
ncbi:MAG: methanogenesis marker 15 protein, partial [Candidatus Methanoperedens sp.]|nr:methanogenesis marker 15 protein [Candidatus Methanoperedens sp.]